MPAIWYRFGSWEILNTRFKFYFLFHGITIFIVFVNDQINNIEKTSRIPTKKSKKTRLIMGI